MKDYLTLLDSYDFSDYRSPAGDLKKIWEEEADLKVKKLLEIEMDCVNFTLWEGKLQPIFSKPDNTGRNIVEYPSIEDFNDDAINYIGWRLSETPNKRLEARYGQILWNSGVKKKGKYVQAAVDAYFSLLTTEVFDQDFYYTDIVNLLFLSVSSNYRIDEAKSLVIKAVVESASPYDHFVILVPKVLEQRKYFSREEIQSLADKSEHIWTDSNKMSLMHYEMIAEKALDISNALGNKQNEWRNRMGDLYEKSIDLRKDDETGMIPLQFCERAIRYYHDAGNRNKEKELLRRLTELKANLKLSTIEIKFTSKELSEIYDYHKSVIKSLLKRDADRVIGFLAFGQHIFPKVKFLKNVIKARGKSLSDFMNVVKYDINKNTAKSKPQKDELTEKLLEEYGWYVQIVAVPFLYEIFKQGLFQQRINFKTVIEFLYKHSWIAKNISYKDSGGEPHEHNWLAMIAPALQDFFAHWHALQFSKSRYENFIVCTDSLSLKFEGLLRDFAKLIGATSQVHSRGWNREAYIEDLLEDEKIKTHFDEDDLLFFKYLFTSQGRNVRNNVAHAFYKFHHYRSELVILVIVAILRISKYQATFDKIVL